jgi:hypothetical protein
VAVEKADDADEAQMERALARMGGMLVTAVQPFAIHAAPVAVGLLLEFANGANLVLCPNPEIDQDEEPLADWELFTPFHTYLRCGPGFVWSYLPADRLSNTKCEGVA